MSLFSFLFPPRCCVSGKVGTLLSPEYQAFPAAPANQVRYRYLDQIYARTKYYDPVVQKVTETFKFRGGRSLCPIMAKAMVSSFPKGFITPDTTLVPIPLHWRRWLFRGYNQSLALAKALQQIIPFEIGISTGLRRLRHTVQQSKNVREKRLTNLSGCFVWKGSTPPKEVILVDDVVASGATLDEAAKVLKQSGVKVVKAVVWARGGGRCW